MFTFAISSPDEFLYSLSCSSYLFLHNSPRWCTGFVYHKSYYICPLSTSVLLSPKPVTITFVSFALYGHTLVRQLPVPLQPLSFTPNLITVILSTINSLSLNYPVSSTPRTLLLVLSWKLPSHVISLLSYALLTGSGSLNASNTSSSHLPTKFSQLPDLHTFISLSPLNFLAVLALHPSLLLLGHFHHSL